MQVRRHTSAFCQSLIEAGADGSRDLQHTQSVDNPYDEDTGENAENSEPVRLVPGRRDAEVQAGTGLVPDPIVIACDDPKPVSPCAKITIACLPRGPWCLP